MWSCTPARTERSEATAKLHGPDKYDDQVKKHLPRAANEFHWVDPRVNLAPQPCNEVYLALPGGQAGVYPARSFHRRPHWQLNLLGCAACGWMGLYVGYHPGRVLDPVLDAFGSSNE